MSLCLGVPKGVSLSGGEVGQGLAMVGVVLSVPFCLHQAKTNLTYFIF